FPRSPPSPGYPRWRWTSRGNRGCSSLDSCEAEPCGYTREESDCARPRMNRGRPVPLGLYYFAFFAGAGIYVPYLGLYTRDLGFTSFQIGVISALTPLSKILFPPVWGIIADRSGSRKSLILVTTTLSILAFSALFGVRTFVAVALAILAYAFFHAPILALSETLVLEESARTGLAYGRIRVWGSVGYLLSALEIGRAH